MDNNPSKPKLDKQLRDFVLHNLTALAVKHVASAEDIRTEVLQGTENCLRSLREAGVSREIDELLNAGCEKELLVAAILASTIPGKLANFIYGTPDRKSSPNEIGNEFDAMKYAISAYVMHATRRHRPHDREVAAIIAALTGRRYSDENHRQWRRRYWKKIKPSVLLELVVSITQEILK